MKPKNQILFPGQQPDEEIHLVLRQHWVVLFLKISLWFVMVLLYLAIDFFSISYLPGLIEPTYLQYVEMFKVAYLMYLSLGLFIIIILWYLNMQVITNERVVDIEQQGLLHHTISELHLDQMQDVTAEVHGLPENIWDYGDVYVQTAGETQRFLFHKIPEPTKVTKTLIDLYEQLPEQQKHSHTKSPEIKNLPS